MLKLAERRAPEELTVPAAIDEYDSHLQVELEVYDRDLEADMESRLYRSRSQVPPERWPVVLEQHDDAEVHWLKMRHRGDPTAEPEIEGGWSEGIAEVGSNARVAILSIEMMHANLRGGFRR